jgi:hypothetical protein
MQLTGFRSSAENNYKINLNYWNRFFYISDKDVGDINLISHA